MEKRIMEAIEFAKDVTRHPLVGKRMIVDSNRKTREVESGARGYLKGVEVIILTAPYKVEIDGRPYLFVKVHSLGSSLDYTLPFKESCVIDKDFE